MATQAELDRRAEESVVDPQPNATSEHKNLCRMALVDLGEDLEEVHEKLRKRIERDADQLARRWIPAFRFMKDSIARDTLNRELARLRQFQNTALENKLHGSMIADDFGHQMRLLDPGPETEEDTLGVDDGTPENAELEFETA